LSDKLLKSSAISDLACCCEVAYITLSSFRVNLFFRSFSPAVQNFLNLSTPWLVSRCSVSMEAHYRDPNLMHKPFFDLLFWLLSFQSFR